jgi:hypothetical protein
MLGAMNRLDHSGFTRGHGIQTMIAIGIDEERHDATDNVAAPVAPLAQGALDFGALDFLVHFGQRPSPAVAPGC